jgi:hypothetical protein
MKKRKPPILLATMLLVLLGIVAFVNMPNAKAANDGHQNEAIENTAAQGTAREAVDPKVVADRVKGATKSSPGATTATPVPIGEAAVGSKITIPEPGVAKPKLDSNTIQSLRGFK